MLDCSSTAARGRVACSGGPIAKKSIQLLLWSPLDGLDFAWNNIPMITPGTLDELHPEAVIEENRAILNVIQRALEAAIPRAKAFFDNEGRPVDPFLFPNLVRWHTKQLLVEQGRDVRFEQGQLANNGLWLITNKWNFRILKSDPAGVNGVPLPGPSQSKQEYYCQMPVGLPLEQTPAPIGRINLIVLWDVDLKHNFESIRLVLPIWGTENTVSIRFNEPVSHPALTIVAPQESGTEPEELPIVLDQPEGRTGTTNQE